MSAPERSGARSKRVVVLGGLALSCVVMAAWSATVGAVPIPVGSLFELVLGRCGDAGALCTSQQEAVLTAIRLPRIALGLITGAALALAGAALQGIFRNPLAEPGLIGVSSGAMIGAIGGIFALSRVDLSFLDAVGRGWLVPLCAFVAGAGAVWAVWRLSTQQGYTSVATMILAGVALNALAGAVLGLVIHVADDAELRSLTAWSLGSLGAARTSMLPAPLLALVVSVGFLCPKGSELNALSLGESAAINLGVDVGRLRRVVVGASTLAVGATVAFTGLIGFVGLVVPHMLRLMFGPDHRLLLPASALAGAALLVGADMVARTIVAPSELAIGVVTALVGAPWFIVLLARGRQSWST